MLFRVIPEELIARKNEQELVLYFKNGSVLQLKGSDDPDALRGAGPAGVVFDEFAKVKEEAWQVVEPILRANGGWAWFIGTPKGKNHLHKFYLKGQEPGEMKSWLLRASTSGIIAQDQLEAAKASMMEAMYQQEFECDFLEGEGSVFRGFNEIMTSQPQKPIDGHYYVMGVDLAKHVDWTVITVYDRGNNCQVYQDRFQKIEWPYQIKKIVEISRHYNNAVAVIDATGAGDPVFDAIGRESVPVIAFKFTEESKKDLVEKLSIWTEQRKYRLLPLPETRTEFEVFTYELTPQGRVRYTAPPGFHDDIVMANALAIWSLNPIISKTIPEEEPLIRQYYKKELSNAEGEIPEGYQ